jgi:hypothetical protein
MAMASAVVYAQQQPAPPASDPNQGQGQFSGQSNPPADDVITAQQDPVEPEAKPEKPRAGKPLVQAAPAGPAGNGVGPSPALNYSPAPAMSYAAPNAASAPNQRDGTDNDIVHVAPANNDPGLNRRYAEDPDGDIVHPHPLGPGEVAEGTTIRVRLTTELSTGLSQVGEPFEGRVASDVLQDGKVLIPAGAAIRGHVVEVSEGHAGGHGTIRLRPDTVVLADGQQFHMDAMVTGTPGSRTRVSGEGTINAGSRWKKDGVEYGGAVGAGAVTGAVIAGPVGALTGSLIGAGAITVHLLIDHPQARLGPGTVLLITLNSRLNLVATTTASN